MRRGLDAKSSANLMAFFLYKYNTSEVLQNISRVSKRVKQGDYLVDRLCIPVKVDSVLGQHFKWSAERAPCHSIRTMGMTGGIDIRAGPVYSTVS